MPGAPAVLPPPGRMTVPFKKLRLPLAGLVKVLKEVPDCTGLDLGRVAMYVAYEILIVD